jgi:hypothetical protein
MKDKEINETSLDPIRVHPQPICDGRVWRPSRSAAGELA